MQSKDKINELQKSGMLLVFNQSVVNGEKIQILINRLIDWLLYNLDEIKSYIKEMDYLGASTVYGSGIVGEDVDVMEKNIIDLEDAKKMVKSVENTLIGFEEQSFDIYVDRYHNNLKYSEIANFEGISEITVKRAIKEIRSKITDGFDNDEIPFDTVFNLRKKLNSIRLEKVS